MRLRNRCRPRLIAKQERLMRLHLAIIAKTRKTAPLPEESKLYELGWCQDDHGGGWPVGFPLTEIEAWQRERFDARMTSDVEGRDLSGIG
jgi:hypothetical protein